MVLNSSAKGIFKIFGWSAIALAIVLSILPYLFPLLAPNPQQLKQWAMRELAYPVELKTVKFDWEKMSPVIVLSEVKVLSADQKTIVLHAQKVKMVLSLRHILFQGLHLNKLIIDGADVNFEYQNDHLYVVGLANLGWDFAKPSAPPSLPLSKKILIQNSKIHLRLAEGKNLSFTDAQLWVETEKRLKIRGAAKLLGLNETRLQFGVDIPAKDKQPIQLYGHWQGEGIESLIQFFPVDGLILQKAYIDAQFWAQYKNKNDLEMQAQLALKDLKAISPTGASLAFSELTGEIQAQYKNKQWSVAGLEWQIKENPHEDFLPLDFSIKSHFYLKEHCWELKAAHLPLTQWTRWLDKMGWLPAQMQAKNFQAQGNLDYLHIVATKNDQWVLKEADLAFTNVALQINEPSLQLTPVSGAVNLVDQHAKILIASEDVTLHYPTWFNQSLTLNKVNLLMDWQFLPKEFVVKAKWDSDLFSGLGMARLDQDSQWPVVDIILNAYPMPFDKALTFLPQKILPPQLCTWLESSLKGDLMSASMVLRGNLADFPFDNKKGNFDVTANVKNVRVNYAQDWPDLQDVTADLHFNNRTMLLNNSYASIAGDKVQDLTALIPDLGADVPILNVEGTILSRLEHGLSILAQTPLKQSFAKTLNSLTLSGGMKLFLGLEIPLHSDKLAELQAKGSIILQEATGKVPAWDLSVEKLKGSLSFTKDSLRAENLTGQFLGQPLKLQVQSDFSQPDYHVIATGGVKLDRLQKWLKLNPVEYIKGQTEYTAELTAHTESQALDLNITSSLVGVSVEIPNDIGKPADQARPLDFKLHLAPNELLRVALKYGDKMSGTYSSRFQHNAWHPIGAHLFFGEKKKAQYRKDQILFIEGDLVEVDLQKWQDFFKSLGVILQEKSTFALAPVVELNIENLNLFGNIFAQTKVAAQWEAPQHWHLSCDGPMLKGKMDIPLGNPADLISADFQRINVDGKMDFNQKFNQKETSHLHPIDLKIGHLTAGKKKFENIHIRLEPTLVGYDFPQVQAKLKDSQLRFSGHWDYISPEPVVQAKGKIETQNIGDFLNSLGFAAAALQEAKGVVNFTLQWNGTPAKIDFPTLGGQAEFILHHGYLTGVNPGLTRILNLLNLDNVQRRLNLDFSDVTKNSFAFDELKGKFQFGKGKMSSNNISMKGPSAKITAFGQADLTSRALNGEVAVMPNVTGSLPVAAAIAAGNPAVGAAVWVVDKMLSHKIQEINRFNYQISGTWQTPVVQELSPNARGNG